MIKFFLLLFFIFPNLFFANDEIIKGISVFGFETEYQNLMCTWAQPVDFHLKKIKDLGFNYIRLPFSADFVFESESDYSQNKWKKMDLVFEEAYKNDLNIVLDFHRLEKTHQSARPYNNKYTFDEFLQAWNIIIDRYLHYPNLHGLDIFNEFQGNNPIEWNSLSRQIVNYLELRYPKQFDYYVGGTNWGGSLRSVDLKDLPFSDRIFYTIHKYHFSDFPPYEPKWEYSFSLIEHPVVTLNVGEWGYISDRKNEIEWAEAFVTFLIEHDIRNTFFWCYSFNSGDTQGILKEDCETVDYDKMNLLYRLWDEELR